MLGAEIEHLLRLADAADARAGEGAPVAEEAEHLDGQRFGRGSNAHEGAVQAKQPQVRVHVDDRADRVDDQVEAIAQLGERRGIARGEVVVGAKPEAVFLLAQRLREHGHVGTHRVRDLDGHVAEPAHSDDGDLRAGAGVPVRERRVCRDAGAQQWRSRFVRDALGDLEHEVLDDHDVRRVAALGDRAVGVARRVGADVAVQAVVLVARQAVLALTAGVDHAADTDSVAELVSCDLRPELGDDADDLVTDHLRILDRAPVATHRVDIGMADPRVPDLDQHIVRSEIASLDRGRNQWLGGGRGGVGVDGQQDSPGG